MLRAKQVHRYKYLEVTINSGGNINDDINGKKEYRKQ